MTQYVPAVVLAGARAIAVASLPDTCVRLAWTAGRDADGQETEGAWTAGTTFACGFQPIGTREAGTNQVTTQDRLRLPLSAEGVMDSRDRIRLTHRRGVALATAPEYSLDGGLLVGPTGILTNLTQVST